MKNKKKPKAVRSSSKPKKAFITGITGQDGSYLAEFLLKKGYEVHGLIRRASTFNTERIDHLYQDPHIKGVNLFLHYGDLTDGGNLMSLLKDIQPDEVYNLGAQSHVRVSFDVPEYTVNTDADGALRMLEAIRHSGVKTKFYQASSSEMFGEIQENPQKETTPFHPRSPYGCAKLFSHWITINYRESYDMFTCSGILFNHETIAAYMPMFCKEKGSSVFDIKPIREIVSFDETQKQYQSKEVSDIQVWSNHGWTNVTFASAYPHNVKDDNKHPRYINARAGAYMATSSHVVFMKDGSEKETGNINVGEHLYLIDLPKRFDDVAPQLISEEEAELLGMMVGDGSATKKKKGIGIHAKFTNSDQTVRTRFDYLWKKVVGGNTVYYPSRSGYVPDKIVGQLRLNGGNNWLRKIDIYNKDRTKRVPKIILNSSKNVKLAFLRGYNVCDGLKANLCTYEFKNFKTNSPTLAMGLWYLIDETTKQDINLTIETKDDGRLIYSLNLLTVTNNVVKEEIVKELVYTGVSQRETSRMSGISRTFIRKIQQGGEACKIHPLKKESPEVKKIIELPNYEGWFYDLETSCGEFHAGIGRLRVHNSPRRGETFVTRKITRALARIQLGLEEKLYLGNLEAKRDWGFAGDYVDAMWRMLQQKKPADYVIATGETHSVREFLMEAFKVAGIKVKSNGKKGAQEKFIDTKTGKVVVEIDPRYYRPAEVDILLGDSSKAKRELKWEPKIKFKELVKMMYKEDLEREKNKEKMYKQYF